MRRLSMTVAATAAAVLLGASAASAAPDHQVVDLECDDGGVYEALVHGNGAFTPARLVGGGVLVPVSLGDFEFEAVLPDGTVVTDSAPGVVDEKGKGAVAEHSPRPMVTCTFEASYVLEEADGELPAGTAVTFSGVATALLTGRG